MSILTESAPAVSVIRCDGVQRGRPDVKEVAFVFGDNGEALPSLTILSNRWSRREVFRDQDTYAVEEIPGNIDGRTFLLHRSAESIDADLEAGIDAPDTRYGVFIARNGQDDVCECRGNAARGYCKHVSVIRHLVESGHVDEPGSDCPIQMFPTPEQPSTTRCLTRQVLSRSSPIEPRRPRRKVNLTDVALPQARARTLTNRFPRRGGGWWTGRRSSR